MSRLSPTISDWYDRYSVSLLTATAFLLPLKLSLTYIPLLPLLILWLLRWVLNGFHLHGSSGLAERFFLFALIPVAFAPFGKSPERMLHELPTLFVYGLLIFAAREAACSGHHIKILKSLMLGAVIGSVGTILTSLFPATVPRLFLGQISGSGQLALMVPLFVGSYFFRDQIKDRFEGFWASWCPILILAMALIANLKRGPWAGVMVAVILLAFLSRRLKIAACLAAVCGVVVIYAPMINQRLIASETDFLEQGGRKEMWEIATILSLRNPLGIGWDNSRILRNYSDHIPAQLSHFHSNPINILVELGWPGLVAFFWFFGSVISVAFSWKEGIPFGAAILSSQLAGLVEYNFGDTKVYLLTLLLIGLLDGLRQRRTDQTE